MRKRTTLIPVNHFGDENDSGISIERMTVKELPAFAEKLEQSERHNWHSFHLLEKGSLTIEIDFQQYQIKAPSIVYMHPNQVHRVTAFSNFTVCSWAISNENLDPEYLSLLEEITPAIPLQLNKETFTIFSETVSLCIKFSKSNNLKLHRSMVKDSCNALTAMAISQYSARAKPAAKLSRAEILTRSFNDLLEQHYADLKRPAEYAQRLNVSTAYLNECVKNTTGHPVSYHIQQQIILQAKRLLYHSARSVKEIASDLGYDDYSYFSRLFIKLTGATALAFRNKNRD